MTDNTPLRPIPATMPKKKEEEPLTPEQLEEFQKEATKLRNESNCKMISVALMEAALRYRQGHYLEEIERFEEQVMEEFRTHKDYNKPGWARKYESLYKKKILDYKEAKEVVNRVLEKEIKNLTSALKKDSAVKFDDFATIFGEVASELVHAKNRKDFHIVCKMYNMGFMEKALEEIKNAEKNNQKTDNHETTEEQPRETVGDITTRFNSAALQEGHHLTIIPEGESEPTGEPNLNHHIEPNGSGGDVQDVPGQQEHRDGHERQD